MPEWVPYASDKFDIDPLHDWYTDEEDRHAETFSDEFVPASPMMPIWIEMDALPITDTNQSAILPIHQAIHPPMPITDISPNTHLSLIHI